MDRCSVVDDASAGGATERRCVASTSAWRLCPSPNLDLSDTQGQEQDQREGIPMLPAPIVKQEVTDQTGEVEDIVRQNLLLGSRTELSADSVLSVILQ